MKRKITFSITLVLSVVVLSLISSDSTAKALVFPETAAAALKQSCTLTPSGPASWTTNESANSEVRVRARWHDTVSCEQPSPLEGQIVEIEQRLGIRTGKTGNDDEGHGTHVSGPTQVAITLNEEVVFFHGHVRGPVTCDASVCTLDAEVRANGPRGSHLRGFLSIQFQTTGHVLSFTPDDFELIGVKSGTEFGVIL